MSAKGKKKNSGSSESEEITTQIVHPDDEVPVVNAYINGMHYLKSIMYLWKNISSVMVLEFFLHKILAHATNEGNTLSIRLEIKEKNLITYENRLADFIPNADKMTEEELADKKVVASVKSDELESRIRGLPKNSNAWFIIFNRDKFIRIHRDTDSSTSSPGSLIPIQTNKKHVSYKLPDYPKNPIVKISTNRFVEVLRSASQSSSVVELVFIAYQSGLMIQGRGSAGDVMLYDLFGTSDEPFEGENVEIIIPAAYAKSFTRLGSISPDSSIISIYYEPGKPLMFKGNVGMFGTYRVFARNPKKDSEE